MNLEQGVKLALVISFLGGIGLGVGTAVGVMKYQERIQKEKYEIESQNYYPKLLLYQNNTDSD